MKILFNFLYKILSACFPCCFDQEKNYNLNYMNNFENKNLSLINNNIDCSVCKRKNNDDSVEMICGHMFHYDCICIWLSIKYVCPICDV